MKIILSLVAIFLASVTGTGIRYLKPDRVQMADDPENPIKVTCYTEYMVERHQGGYRGLEIICPDPYQSLSRAYSQDKVSYRVTGSFLDDPDSWTIQGWHRLQDTVGASDSTVTTG